MENYELGLVIRAEYCPACPLRKGRWDQREVGRDNLSGFLQLTRVVNKLH